MVGGKYLVVMVVRELAGQSVTGVWVPCQALGHLILLQETPSPWPWEKRPFCSGIHMWGFNIEESPCSPRHWIQATFLVSLASLPRPQQSHKTPARHLSAATRSSRFLLYPVNRHKTTSVAKYMKNVTLLLSLLVKFIVNEKPAWISFITLDPGLFSLIHLLYVSCAQVDQVWGKGGEGWRALEQASRGHAVPAQPDGAEDVHWKRHNHAGPGGHHAAPSGW